MTEPTFLILCDGCGGRIAWGDTLEQLKRIQDCRPGFLYDESADRWECASCRHAIACWQCKKDIAVSDSDEESEALAEDAEAWYHGESGEWICKECREAEMAYWASQVPVLRAEANMRQYLAIRDSDDPIRAYLTMKGRI